MTGVWRCRSAVAVVVAVSLLPLFDPLAGFADQLQFQSQSRSQSQFQSAMTRRQQGILTGMPFMANVAPRTFVDDTGQKIYVSRAPTRVVSLAPSITEMLFAIGAGDAVVGVTDWCDYPPEAQTRARVGDVRPNLEAVLALRPDLVLAFAAVRNDEVETLRRLKIPLFVMEARSIERVYAHIQTLGRMFDRAPAANALADAMRADVRAVVERTASASRPRVLYVLYHEPFLTVGPGSFIHQLLELAGAENVAKDAGDAYPRLSMEAVLRRDPEILLFPSMGGAPLPESELAPWTKWSTMAAVKHRRLHFVPWALLNRPGPRLGQGLAALARVIHPEVFQEGAP